MGVLSELGGRDLEGGEPVVGLKDSGARVRLGGHGVYGIRKLSRKDPMARGGLFSGEEEVEGAFAVEDSERGGAGAGILEVGIVWAGLILFLGVTGRCAKYRRCLGRQCLRPAGGVR